MKMKLTLLLLICCVFCNAQIVNIPDANFKIKLLGAASTNFFAKDLNGNYFKIDANSDGQIQQSEADNVGELNLTYDLNGVSYYIVSLEGITSFTNLVKLNVERNRIETLTIAGMQHLTDLNCKSTGYYTSTLILDNLPALTTLNCSDVGSNDTNPVYSLTNLPNLKSINFYHCKFTGTTISGLTNLEEMYGEGGFKSQITTLDLVNMPHLKVVNLKMNNFAFISFMPANTIENLNVFGNDLTAFDKTYFTNLKVLNVDWNKLPGLDVSNMTTLTELYCDNGSTSFDYDFTSLNVQGCTNLTKLICTDNLLLSLNLSNLTNLNYLDCQGNNDVFTDTGLQSISLQNCSSLKSIYAGYNPYLLELDLSCSSNYTVVGIYNCTALQRVNLKNGVNESSLYGGVFNTANNGCPNLHLICVDFNEAFASATTAGVAQSPYYNFTPNCFYNTLEGHVRLDLENDGCQNNAGIEGIKIHTPCAGQNCYTYSDRTGRFMIYSQSNNITITPENDIFPLFNFGLTGPVTVNFTPDTIYQTVDLCLAPLGIHNDLEITLIPLENARPGEDLSYKIGYKNKGNQIQSGTIDFTFNDAVLDLINSNPAPTSTSTNAMQWSFTNLLPFESREIDLVLNLNTPMETPPVNLGDVLTYTATITGSSLDEVAENNTASLNQVVTNSFDPNNKICLEGTRVTPDIAGKFVHYVINFENNGTANAHNIVVRDIIDTSKFDITTLSPTKSSHNVYSRITNTNEVEFIFENINLPFDDANNDGYIAFKIKTKPTLVVGNSFSNTASIYFDYNFPIITNTFTSTLQLLGIDDMVAQNGIIPYPNPVKDVLHFKSGSAITKVAVYDMGGRLLMQQNSSEESVNLSQLPAGSYLLKVYTAKGVANAKIIKE